MKIDTDNFRLLDAALKDDCKLKWIPQSVEQVASHCNDRKFAAKIASEKSDELFLALFVKESGPLVVDAVVHWVLDHAIDCILLDMAVVKRVYFDDLEDLESYKYIRNGGKLCMELKWKSIAQIQVLTVFSPVVLRLEAVEDKIDFKAKLSQPTE